MNSKEADDYLRDYRAKLKSWSLIVSGFAEGDSTSLYTHLEEGQSVLSDIAIRFPDKAYSVDMLVNSRTRTWHGPLADRPPRPEERQS
jgi:hypothetical protein